MFQINVREDVYLIVCTFLLVVYTHEMSLHVTNQSIYSLPFMQLRVMRGLEHIPAT